MDTPANQIPSFAYDIGKVPDIGSGYAAGISEAGKGIAAGLGSALDTFTQNRTADDTLQAMRQMKVLSNDAYQAIAGKSLGAKQTLLGMYAGEWIKQQAQERALQQIGFTGTTQADVKHKELLDTINAIQGKYGPGGAIAAGINVQKMPIGAGGGAGGGGAGGGGGVGTPPAVRRAALVQNPTAAQAATAASVNPAIAAPGQPLTTATSTPDVITGPEMDMKANIPPGAQRGVYNGQHGFIMPDGRTFRPFPKQYQPTAGSSNPMNIMTGGV